MAKSLLSSMGISSVFIGRSHLQLAAVGGYIGMHAEWSTIRARLCRVTVLALAEMEDCQMSDGATALVITHRENAEKLGVKPLFSIVSYGQVAVEPETMGEGPALSIPAALENAGMELGDMDLIEVNEAFAIQVLANEKVLKWDRDKLNVHGGAIALGHPTGISGARILVTLYYALKGLDKTYGIAGICGGGGSQYMYAVPIP